MPPSPLRWKTVSGTCLVVATLAFLSLRPDSQDLPDLFRAPADAPAPATVVSTIAVGANSALSTAIKELLPAVGAGAINWKDFTPQKITIAPYPDLPVEFEMTSINEEKGRTVWVGRNAALEGAFLVAAATQNDWHAVLTIPAAGTFEMHISGQSVVVMEKSDNAICGTPRALDSRVATATTEADLAVGDAPLLPAADSLTTVDVLFFYDDATLVQVGTAANFETRMIAHVTAGNAALANSLITNFRWRYLASYLVPVYTTTNDMTDDLYMITGRKEAGVLFDNPVHDFVTEKAVLHGADQLVLYVAGSKNYGGIAWAPNLGSSLPLTYRTAVVASNSSYASLAHELSHNFGCHHDRETDSAPDGNGLYHYAFRFNRAGQDTGTIMSYASARVDYFSNPDVTFNGVVLGVPESQPKAANNARILRENAVTMISARVAVDPPAITSQPQSVTVSAGQPFALNVTATGSSPVYQWKIAGIAITGATGPAYSKSAAAATDSGSYTVTVTNPAGQVESAVALVTVNTAPVVSPSAPSSSGGGGGGGGSVDGWFASIFGLFVIARCIAKAAPR